jgi:indole-3-acetate monooxygenase
MNAPVAVDRSADLLGVARSLAPSISARSLEIEAARTLPADLVRTLRDEHLFQLAMPARLGGQGVAPHTVVEIVEEISRADGATGWCLLIGNIGNAFLAWLDPDVAGAIVAAQPDILIAGGQAPLGQATLDTDGRTYRLRGRWPFGSGCLHSNWYMGGFIVMEDNRPKLNSWGMPEMRVAYFPANLGRVDDTWYVAGLGGTGSHDILADDIAVPVEHTSVPYFNRADQPDPLYRLTAYNLLLTVMAGFPLGVGARALDEVVEQLRTKPHQAVGQPWLEDPAVQTTLMRRRVGLQAARRQLFDTLDEVLADLETGESTYQQRARLAAAVIHAYDAGRDAAVDAFRLSGTAGLLDTNPVQRCMRDLVAGAQHVAFSADSRKRVANALLGLQTAPAFFGV